MLSTTSDPFLKPGHFPVKMTHTVGTKYSKTIEQTVRKRVVASKKRDVSWNVDDSEIPKSFSRLIRVYSDKTAASLRCNAFVAYPLHVV